jgi:hypothetical protein
VCVCACNLAFVCVWILPLASLIALRWCCNQDTLAVVHRIGILYSPHTALLTLSGVSRGIAWRHTCAPLTLPPSLSDDLDPSEDALAIAFGDHVSDKRRPTAR